MSQEAAETGFFNIEQVGSPGRKMAAVEALQRLGMTAHDAAHCVFRRVALLLNEPLDFTAQRGVLGQEGMRFENRSILPAKLLIDGTLPFPSLLSGSGNRLAQALYFVAQMVAVHKTLRNTEQLGIEHQSRPKGDACGNGYATFDFHQSGQRIEDRGSRI